jgi:hypothetical protein
MSFESSDVPANLDLTEFLSVASATLAPASGNGASEPATNSCANARGFGRRRPHFPGCGRLNWSVGLAPKVQIHRGICQVAKCICGQRCSGLSELYRVSSRTGLRCDAPRLTIEAVNSESEGRFDDDEIECFRGLVQTEWNCGFGRQIACANPCANALGEIWKT